MVLVTKIRHRCRNQGGTGAGAPLVIRRPDGVITRLSGYRLSLNSITF